MIARLAIGGLILLAVSILGLIARRRTSQGDWKPAADRVPAALRRPGADGWTVLGFTSALCVACQRTPEIVAEALGTDAGTLEDGDEVAGVRFQAVDVEEHGALVEHLDVVSTPTVVVLDPQGRIRFAHRGNPQPSVLGEHLPRGPRSIENGDRPVGEAVAVLLLGVDRPW